ncbi:MAG: hypothetical protein V2B18_25880 [Pseudomonadota bacterium]
MGEQSNDSEYTTWNPQTYEFIGRCRDAIWQVADQIGTISPASLAGPMAKENHHYLRNPLRTALEQAKDYLGLLNVVSPADDEPARWLRTDEYWRAHFDDLQQADLVHRANSWTKATNPGLIDFGPFNMQGATAWETLNGYLSQHPADDPLNLKQYADSPQAFLVRLSGLSVGEYEADMDETVRLNAAMWGLRLDTARQWSLGCMHGTHYNAANDFSQFRQG